MSKEDDNRLSFYKLKPSMVDRSTLAFRMAREGGLMEEPTRKLVYDELTPLIEKINTDDIHGMRHLNRVLNYALQLNQKYGGDEAILTAAVLLHDLGRNNTNLHGKESRDLSISQSRQILNDSDTLNFYPEEIDEICIAIEDHDQPEKKPRTLVGRILKDADFLAGFGAEGILRTISWTIQSGQTVEDVLDRLKNKMPARIKGLEFKESRIIAKKEYKIVKEFVKELEKPLPKIGGDIYNA